MPIFLPTPNHSAHTPSTFTPGKCVHTIFKPAKFSFPFPHKKNEKIFAKHVVYILCVPEDGVLTGHGSGMFGFSAMIEMNCYSKT